MGNVVQTEITPPAVSAMARQALISRMRTLHKDISLEHPRDLANFMWILYEWKKPPDVDVLNEAIQATQIAADLEQEPSARAQLLYSLGTRLQARVSLLNTLSDLDRAISAFDGALELTSDEEPGKQMDGLNRLGITLFERFKLTGDLHDLEGSATTFCCAIELIADTDPDDPALLNNYASSLMARYKRLDEPEDIECALASLSRANELMQKDYPERAACSNNIGNALIYRYERTGELQDLEQAITAHRRALELTPDGRPEQPLRLNNLGNSLRMRFERIGDLEDLEQAISTLRQAVTLVPDDRREKPELLNSLGTSLLARYKRTEELGDIEHAVAVLLQAAQLTPDDHPDKPSRLNNLGISVRMRFGRSHNPRELELVGALYRRAVALTPDDDPRKPARLSHLCMALGERFARTKDADDFASAVSAGQTAIELFPKDHPALHRCYSFLAGCYQRRFELNGDSKDIEKAVSLFQQSAGLVPDGDPWMSWSLWNVAGAQMLLFKRTEREADFNAAIQSLIKSTLQTSGSPSSRLHSAKQWALLLSEHPSFCASGSLLSAHERIIAILPESVWMGYDIRRRYEESSRTGELVNAAVSVAIESGTLPQAIEWLEAGRALIWSQILSLRTPLDELRASHPPLADALQNVQRQLRLSAHSIVTPTFDDLSGIEGINMNSVADAHRGLVIKYDQLLKNIRACPGFEEFLRPKSFKTLVRSLELASGPIVFINVDAKRCDAIVLSLNGSITLVPLPDFSLQRAAGMHARWNKHMKEHMVRARGSIQSDNWRDSNTLQDVLERMWTWIVGPILSSLDLKNPAHDERLPCITWCPTGPLTQLPLHAAGVYSDPLGPRVYDFVVSSYTPSLSALLRSCEGIAKHRSIPNALILTQPDTPHLNSPLPSTKVEGRDLRDFLSASQVQSQLLEHEQATIIAAQELISRYPWIHLACHGSQNQVDATRSAFELYDGPLTLANLMGTAADDAELAFLSACQTAVGDEKTPEESAHLAAGMLAVGFKGVVGTMWSIGDEDAPVVVKAYYKILLDLRMAGKLGKGATGAAYALHEATRVLREKVGEGSFMRWVPFVHFGA